MATMVTAPTMNIGVTITGMTAIGSTCPMDTTACTMFGGIHGGGIGTGPAVTGVTTGHGISSTLGSMLYGMIRATGGTGQGMDIMSVIGCLTLTRWSG